MTAAISKPKDRIYLVNLNGKEHLVRAYRGATALMHCASAAGSANVATHNDLERLMSKGVRVEYASGEPPKDEDAGDSAGQSDQQPQG